MTSPAGGPIAGRVEVLNAAWQTWGARGIARRSAYELARRSGRLRAAEERWTSRIDAPTSVLGPVGTSIPDSPGIPEPARADPRGQVRLYGGLDVDLGEPPEWHRHPLTGHQYPADVHWSELGDSGGEGDIKDIWEPSRLGWLQPIVRSWAVSGDDEAAERAWGLIEHWHHQNPAYRGPNWMCGQETSLRTISIVFAADAMAASASSTRARRLLVSTLVQDAVGRVAPTLGYALSQRNNHAVSEAGFLWTASVLAPWLPDAARSRRRSSRALTEVMADQFEIDGSYAQHSPTYHRVALHVLLWCLSVARANNVDPPPGVTDAVARSVDHLRCLMVPGSEGRVPNLGGNDGALVFDLSASDISDFRPILAHAAAATGRPSGLGAGLWDEEARWFGVEPQPESVESAPQAGQVTVTARRGSDTHVLTVGRAHAVLRAGRSRHRPAHADQLHVDLWLAGVPVAIDPGVYRYSAAAPWDNALADESVHNLARRPGVAQAVRSDRFFWRRWSSASIERLVGRSSTAYAVAGLALIDGTVLRRLVAVADGVAVVVDWITEDGIELRWNLPPDVEVEMRPGTTAITGGDWQGRILHGGQASVADRNELDPESGWQATIYGVRQPSTALLIGPQPVGTVVSVFALGDRAPDLAAISTAARGLDHGGIDDASITALFTPVGRPGPKRT